jgi:type VI secretion system secreted protein VgrG
MADNTQENRQLELVTPLGKDVLLVTGATVHERISGLFSIDLDILSEDPNVDFESILGKQVTLKQALPDDNIRFFNGFVGHFKGCGIQHGLWAYTARVYPWLWLLTHTCDCRIFQNQKVPDIIRQVFDDLGFNDYEIRLTEEYKEWEYCVQYRESDFNFVSRLMEHEGVFYFFTHEEERHTLVLADSNASLKAFDGFESIPFSMTDASGGSATQEAIRAVHMEKQIHPGSFTQRDFDFKVPKKNLTTLHAISRKHDHSEYEVYDYPGHYVESSHGEAYTKARIEAIRAGYETISCESDARGISSGFYFDLTGHPGQLYNKRYLVTSVEHQLSTGSGFQSGVPIDGSGCNVFFQAIDFDTPYRPAMKTRKPVVEGPQTAIVCGPKGDEIYTDEYGRVKVQFHWDREGQLDENSSCWIRVSQLWAGKKWGAMYIPRITQEVIVEFLEGDPDQPIITGRVYNGKSMPPYDLPAEKTKSTIKSDSSKGGNGFNEIRFEDKKGDEQVFFHAEKNMDVHVKNDSFESILGNRHQTIGSKDNADQIELVHGDKHLKVIGDRISKIQSNDNLTVEGSRMVAVQGDDNLSTQGDLLIKADGTISLKGMSIKIEASSGFEIKCGGSSISLTPSALFLAGGPLININSGSGPPVVAASPAQPDIPKEPKPADNAQPGEPFEEPARPAVSKPEAPAAKVLHQAAEDGTPFCEECERARQEQEKNAAGEP